MFYISRLSTLSDYIELGFFKSWFIFKQEVDPKFAGIRRKIMKISGYSNSKSKMAYRNQTTKTNRLTAGKELFQTGFGNDVLDQRREE